jgi:glycosyltransferase involved in cell wall biosynthesis
MSPTVKYVIVAGKNIRGSSNESYLTYYDTVMQDAVDAGIRWINYIPENDVEAFFSAADSLVMPYTRSHAASGPLSIASSLGKPVILSVNVDAPEFHGLAIEPTAPALADAISRINMDDEYRDRLVRASAEFAERRSPVNTATAHVKALFD